MSYVDCWKEFIREGSELGPEYNIPLNISYGVYNVFQRYWEGQSDPLYAVLSRRGDSVDWVTVEASQEEADRMREVAEEIVSSSDDPMEKRTAQMQLDRLKDTAPHSEYEQSLQQSYKGLNENALIDFAMLDYLWKNLKVPGIIDDYLAKKKNKGGGKSVNDKIDDWFKNNMGNPLVRGLYRALMMTGPNYGDNYADQYKRGELEEAPATRYEDLTKEQIDTIISHIREKKVNR